MRTPVVLRIYKGEQLLGVKQFLDEQIVIGSQPTVQVPLTGDKVSLIHAVIEDREGSWYVCDLGSESGTFKNEEAILDARFDSGDNLRIGDFRLEFFIGVPKPKAAPAQSTPVQAPPAQVSSAEPRPVEKPPVADSKSSEVVSGSVRMGGAAATGSNQTSAATPPPTSATAVATDAPAPVQAPVAAVSAKAPSHVAAAAAPAVAKAVSVSPQGLVSPVVTPSHVMPSTRQRGTHKAKKKKATFAPASKYQSFREFVRPSKGTVVEVLVLWRERVISAHHFSNKPVITMGSHPDSDIVLPVMVSRQRKVPVLKIDARAIVLITPEMSGELIKGQQSSTFPELLRQNRMMKEGASYALVLDQGEMIRLELTDQVSVIIRYTSDSPKPLVAPLFDLTAAEFTGMIMALVMVGVLWLYNVLWTPPAGLTDDLSDEPLRTAVIEIKKKEPIPTPVPEKKPEPPPTPRPTATPPPVKSTPAPVKNDEKKPTQHKAQAPKTNPGAASNAAPNKNPKDAPKIPTSIKQGGAVKTGDVGGAQAKSQRRDVNKSGVFSVFGGGGRQDKLDTSYSGAGELSGFADSATGRAGQNTNRPGEGLGTQFKDTGRGGTGTAAVGVAGVTTKGRGGGSAGYGTDGLGGRRGVQIVPGGNEESFSGSIDREAIRRVVRQNLRAIQTCYERELNRNPDLFGKVVIKWTIGEQGRVMRASVGSNEMAKAPRVAECVRDIIRSARFPEPPTNEEVEVAYPFFFAN